MGIGVIETNAVGLTVIVELIAKIAHDEMAGVADFLERTARAADLEDMAGLEKAVSVIRLREGYLETEEWKENVRQFLTQRPMPQGAQA